MPPATYKECVAGDFLYRNTEVNNRNVVFNNL